MVVIDHYTYSSDPGRCSSRVLQDNLRVVPENTAEDNHRETSEHQAVEIVDI